MKKNLPTAKRISILAKNLGTVENNEDEEIFYYMLTYYIDRNDKISFLRAVYLLFKKGNRQEAAHLLAGQIKAYPDDNILRARFSKLTGHPEERIDDVLSSVPEWRIEDFFLIRKCGQKDAPFALWLTSFTDKSEVHMTTSFVRDTGQDMLIICLSQFHKRLGLSVNRITYNACLNLRPSVVILLGCGLSEIEANVTPALLGFAKKHVGFGLITLWMDSAKPLSKHLIRSYAPFADVIAAYDDKVDADVSAFYPEKCLDLWYAINASLLEERGESRDIDISFVGKASGHYAYRAPFIERIRKMGVNHLFAGTTFGRFIDNDEHASVVRRSRIVLNFSGFTINSCWDIHPPHGARTGHHLKLRAFEALHAGALLLESEESPLSRFLKPGVHYVTYRDIDDMERLVREMLADDGKRLGIAAAGCAMARKSFTSQKFWSLAVGAMERNNRHAPCSS